MINKMRLKIVSIIIYLLPIIIVTIITRTLNYFLLTVGIMTVFLGIGLLFIPAYKMYYGENKRFKSSNYCIIAAGLLILVLSIT